jgi:hypothetical protein
MDSFDVFLVLVVLSLFVAVASVSFATGWYLRSYFQPRAPIQPTTSQYLKLKKSKDSALHSDANCRFIAGRVQSELDTFSVCKNCS